VSPPVPVEDGLLANVETLIVGALADGGDHGARLDLLEAVAAELGGFSLRDYRRADGTERMLTEPEVVGAATQIADALRRTPIHPALALTSLARAPMTVAERRKAGAYYTDFRLAKFLASRCLQRYPPGARVIDAASGTGILLVAMALAVCNGQNDIDRFIAESVHAADLSSTALRGVKLALASLTSDATAIESMAGRLRCIDSLIAGPDAWSDVAADGFDLVIGNPPWEKLKVTRHEYLAAAGVERHYGAGYDDADLTDLPAARERINAYTAEAAGLHALHGGGEIDLYKLFLSLAIQLAKPGGELAVLVPAGLIRAHGTAALRRHLLEQASDLRIAVLFNHGRFFSIDTRFKFLAVHALLDPASRTRRALVLEHAAGTENGVEITGSARIGRSELRRTRPDLSVPEVRSAAEWSLFRRMCANGVRLDAKGSVWTPTIVREVDMTRDRPCFEREGLPGLVPLVEGRMVHQFRHTAKAYVSGSGRRAQWDVCEVGEGRLTPQFWIDPGNLPEQIQARVAIDRIGFCDIAGQTNERAMMAARIPAAVACGNKVPTITLPGASNPATPALWLAIANSLAFDWLLRRVLTTTVNYFVLRSVPFPDLDPGSASACWIAELVELVEAASHTTTENSTPQRLAELRSEIDALVMRAYGVEYSDVELILGDFPLLDRGQVPLPGESRSTITSDLLRRAFQRLEGATDPRLEERVANALLLGAAAYVPAEFAKVRRPALV
jgi:methylase of polypeptide subunit release factors